MIDLISRQDAINDLKNLPRYDLIDGYDRTHGVGVRLKFAEASLNNLPTIYPVKHGRWVCGCCNQCGYILHSTGLTNYCPNCGASMGRSEL